MKTKFECPILGFCNINEISKQEKMRAENWYEDEINKTKEKLIRLELEQRKLSL